MSPADSRDSEARRRELWELLGRLPRRKGVPPGRVIDREERSGYTLETLRLDLNDEEQVPAHLLLPRDGTPPYPAVVYNHAHGGDYQRGKRELLEGNGYLQDPPYAEVLISRGIAVIAIDHWCFGERNRNSELYLFKRMLWNGQVLWGMMVYDTLRTIDYLAARPDIDYRRLGTLGLSMGSTMAWWSAALEPRLSLCVDICCLTDFQALLESGGLGGHGIYYYVPDLLNHFTTAQINGLIAPRAHLSLAGELDPLTPPEGLDRIDEELTRKYGDLGVPDRWKLLRFESGHEETPAMRRAVEAWLDQHLLGAG